MSLDTPAPRILAYPRGTTAYTNALTHALKGAGAEVIGGEWSGAWLWRTLKRGDLALLHWPSFQYGPGSAPPARAARAFLRFAALLLLMRARGARLAWVAHNLLPHDRSRIAVFDVWARHLVIGFSTRIFVHGTEAERVLLGRFPRAAGKTVEIPHGHWIGHYRSPMPRPDARRQLGLRDDRYVYLFCGQVHAYKNVVSLVRAFRKVARDDAVLVIAGRFPDRRHFDEVSALAQEDSRIRVDDGYIPNDDMPAYLGACDVVCAPYRDILTSGTAMLAASFGRPLISVDKGFLRDVVTPATGMLYDPAAPDGLERCMNAVRECVYCAEEIMTHARRFTFDEAARRMLNALRPDLALARGTA